jgi:hypothetical protein
VNADGSAIEGGEAAARQEIAEMRARMEELSVEAAAAVEAGWKTQWRHPEVFALKVQTRLTMNTEYRALVDKVRTAEAALNPK